MKTRMVRLMRCISWFGIMVVVQAALPGASQAQPNPREKADREKQAQIEQLIKTSVRSFQIYGQVVDQYGAPVSGARVTMHLRGYDRSEGPYFMDVQEKVVKTDAQGRFEIKNIKAIDLFLKMIEKEGYEFQRDAEADQRLQALNEDPSLKPNPDQPLVYHLRKRNEPAYVIMNEFRDRFSAAPASYVMNLAAGVNEHAGRLDTVGVVRSYVPSVKPVDLIICSTYEPQTGFTIQLLPPDTNTAILEHNTIEFTAPETGYQTNAIVMPFSRQVNTNKFLERCYYVRGRRGQLFARLEVKYRPNAAKTNLSFTIKTYANPNGSRNLEYNSEYNFLHDYPDEKPSNK